MDNIFSPVGSTVNMTATTGGVALALTAPTTRNFSVRLYNAGAVAVFTAFGISTTTCTTTTGMPIPPGGVEVFEVSPSCTHVYGITASGTAVLYATSGNGA